MSCDVGNRIQTPETLKRVLLGVGFWLMAGVVAAVVWLAGSIVAYAIAGETGVHVWMCGLAAVAYSVAAGWVAHRLHHRWLTGRWPE